jgi:hypothetical protein
MVASSAPQAENVYGNSAGIVAIPTRGSCREFHHPVEQAGADREIGEPEILFRGLMIDARRAAG